MIKSGRSTSPALLCIVVLSTFGAGCGGGSNDGATKSVVGLPPAVEDALTHSTPVPQAIVSADNNFAFSLLSQMRTADAGKNVFISPVSVSICLDMLYNGSAGSTQLAMASTLGLGSLSVSDLNNDNAALQASLVSSDPSVQLMVANSLWYHKSNTQLLSNFISSNTQYYGSYVGDLSGAPNNINAWVSTQTGGKITQIAGPGAQNNVAMLVNAVYFRGAWTSPFDAAATTIGTFTLADNSTMPCSMMQQTSSFPYYKGDHFQAVELPYGKGRTKMLILLPDTGTSLNNLLAEVNAVNLNNWLAGMAIQVGAVALPKFSSSYSVDLKPVLTALGMGVAFDPNNANFSNMGPQLFVDSAIHKTYLSIDESGTVATGATSIGIGATDEPVSTFTMTMNRPFVCTILDTQTGDILFYGAIDTPSP